MKFNDRPTVGTCDHLGVMRCSGCSEAVALEVIEDCLRTTAMGQAHLVYEDRRRPALVCQRCGDALRSAKEAA